MKIIKILILFISLTATSQNGKIILIDNLVKEIEAFKKLNKTTYQANEIFKIETDNGGEITTWNNEQGFVKIIENYGLSFGFITRIIYLHNEKPIKAIEIEQNFEKNGSEMNYEKLKEVFRTEVYILGRNKTTQDYEFLTKDKGKRIFTEYYSDSNSILNILNEMNL